VMNEEEGEWFRCDGCGHIVSPGGLLTKCNCANCFALERSIARRLKFTVSLQGRGQ
jgi:hypothetical protein